MQFKRCFLVGFIQVIYENLCDRHCWLFLFVRVWIQVLVVKLRREINCLFCFRWNVNGANFWTQRIQAAMITANSALLIQTEFILSEGKKNVFYPIKRKIYVLYDKLNKFQRIFKFFFSIECDENLASVQTITYHFHWIYATVFS